MLDRVPINPGSEPAVAPQDRLRRQLAGTLQQWRSIRAMLRDRDFRGVENAESRLAAVTESLKRLAGELQSEAAVISSREVAPPAVAACAEAIPMPAAGGFDTGSIEQGPSLAAILERLRRPADTDTGVVHVPQARSLSDEDLLGLEMMNLVGAATDEARPTAQPSIAPPSVSLPAEPATAAATFLHDDPSGVFDGIELPAEKAEVLSHANAPATEAESRRDRVESAYSAALFEPPLAPIPAAENTLRSVEPANSTTPSPGAPEVAPDHRVEAGSSPFGDDGLSLAGIDEGQDAFVRSTIEHSNLAKLDQLRRQLQEVFRSAGQPSSAEDHAGFPAAPEPTPSSVTSSRTSTVSPDQADLAQSGPDPATGDSADELIREIWREPASGHREEARTELLAQPPPWQQSETSFPVPSPESIPNTLPTETDPQELTMNTTEQSRSGTTRENHFSGLTTAAFLTNLDQQEMDSASRPAPVPLKPAVPQPHRPSAAEGNEPDVADYMQQLLGRLRGGQTAASPAAAPTPVKPEPVAPVAEQAPVEEPIRPLSPEEFVPRAVAPERNLNIDALRQLANQSTRSAVDVFANSQKKALYFAQLAAVGGGVMGAGLFTWLAPSLGKPFYLLALACLGGAGLAGYKFARENLGFTLPRRQKESHG